MIANTEIIQMPQLYIAGLSVRTTNQNGESQRDLKALWTKFMDERVLLQLTNRVSDELYCIYTDYETDHTGYYTAVVGCSVNALTQLREGFKGITIPADKYMIYSLAGKCPENSRLAWQEIWDSNIDRKYTVDYDLYKVNAQCFEDSEAKIYLSIKSS